MHVCTKFNYNPPRIRAGPDRYTRVQVMQDRMKRDILMNFLRAATTNYHIPLQKRILGAYLILNCL